MGFELSLFPRDHCVPDPSHQAEITLALSVAFPFSFLALLFRTLFLSLSVSSVPHFRREPYGEPWSPLNGYSSEASPLLFF